MDGIMNMKLLPIGVLLLLAATRVKSSTTEKCDIEDDKRKNSFRRCFDVLDTSLDPIYVSEERELLERKVLWACLIGVSNILAKVVAAYA